MTGIDRIKAKILDDARGIADENLNRARQEAERIIARVTGTGPSGNRKYQTGRYSGSRKHQENNGCSIQP